MMRRVPANVEKADLIQVGLIAVAQAALSFAWEGDRESEDAREAFVRYARMRVKGAMLDELRQMDTTTRGQRRKIKAIQIARERWLAANGVEAGLAQLAAVCGMDVDEIAELDQLAESTRVESIGADDDGEWLERHHPATEKDEVEARVDTTIVLRRMEEFFARLPERERRVIDAYLGIGLSPVELAASLQLSPARLSQLYSRLLRRLARHFGVDEHHRATDDRVQRVDVDMDRLVAQREADLQDASGGAGWADLLRNALVSPEGHFGEGTGSGRIEVRAGTRWG